jgi:hypothetical protein
MGSRTTIGIMFDAKCRVIEYVLVGGPAYNSDNVFKGDTIMSVDGQDASTGDLATLLRGIDEPDSLVTLGLMRESGEVEDVTLRRMDTMKLEDKREMFDLFANLVSRAKDMDKVMETTVQKCLDLWTAQMLEEFEHDEIISRNIHTMQECCWWWLQELLQILERLQKTVEVEKIVYRDADTGENTERLCKFYLKRAIELTRLAAERIKKEQLCGHAHIESPTGTLPFASNL